MVGIPVTIEYDAAWEGLIKNFLCRCSTWEGDSSETRTILNVGETAVVAPEVMQAGQYLYLGVEGFREDGTLVMPTTWARCENMICYGADSGEDPSADPTLPIWNQLQAQIEQINRDGITQERMEEIQEYAEAATLAAADAARSEQKAAASASVATSNVNAAESFAIQAQTSEQNAKISASSAANLANGALQAQRAAEAAAERAEAAAGSSQTPADLSAVLEDVPGNNLLDTAALVTSFVDSTGAMVTGTFSNYIPVKQGLRYVTNGAPSIFYWFDSEKNHLSTKTYTSSPKILEPEQDGFLLFKLPADYSGCLVLEGTDIDAYRPAHQRLKQELHPQPWAGKRCLVVADSNGEYVRPGFAELVTRDLGMVLHNISAGGQPVAWGTSQLDAMDNRFDLVLVMLGTNDQGYNNTLGTIDDSSGTFYANVKSLVEKLKTRYPKSLTMLMTPIKRTAVGEDAVNDESGFAQNAQGLTTEDYGRAILEVCRLYSMPCIDLYDTVDLRTEADRQLWGDPYNDGTHIGPLAHAVKIAPVVKAGILAHTPYVFPEWGEDDETDDPVEPEEPEPVVTYTITNNLTNITTSNSAASANSGTAYTARLTAAEGYAIDTVAVTMGGVDVTADTYADGIVSIAAVTGNVVITAAAVVAEEPDDGTPKLIHKYGTGVFDATLEDTVGNWDLTFWNEGHGASSIEAMALEQGQSFSVRSKATRQTTLYRTNHYIHSGRNMGITLPTNNFAGHFWLGLENVTTGGYSDTALVNFYYFTANDSTAKSEVIAGTKAVARGDTLELALTWDADTSTVRVYEDGELIGEQVTTVPLKFDGLRIQANYQTDEQAGSCPAEYVEIYRGVVEI